MIIENKFYVLMALPGQAKRPILFYKESTEKTPTCDFVEDIKKATRAVNKITAELLRDEYSEIDRNGCKMYHLNGKQELFPVPRPEELIPIEVTESFQF